MEVVEHSCGPTETELQDDSVHLFIVASQSSSPEDAKYVLNLINSSLNQIGENVLSHKDEIVNAVSSHQFDSSNLIDQNLNVCYSNEKNFEFEFLANSTRQQFKQSFKQLLTSRSKSKYFINATHDHNSNCDLNLNDSLFTIDDIQLLFKEFESLLKRDNFKLQFYLAQLKQNWKLFEKLNPFTQMVAIQTPEELNYNYSDLFQKYFNQTPVESFMSQSPCTGTLKITRPCLYIFPASQGDSAYFTINGYSMLINGGYDRLRPCFWKFVNMLQQIDSVLITHTDSDSLGGLTSFFHKKTSNPELKPSVLSILANLVPSHHNTSSQKDLTSSPAKQAVSLITQELSQSNQPKSDVDLIYDAIERLKIKLQPLVKHTDNLLVNQKLNGLNKYEHLNLYFKLGHGSLDLFVLSPSINSAELKDYCQQQAFNLTKSQKSHLMINQVYRNLPMSHLSSAVVLLTWSPSYNPRNQADNNVLRLLFTGNVPQHVLFHSLDKLKEFDLLTQPVYKVKPSENVNPLNGLIKKPVNLQLNKENGSNLNGSNQAKPVNQTKPNGTSHNESIISQQPATKPVNGNSNSAPRNTTSVAAKPPKSANGETKKVDVKKPTNQHDTSFSKQKKPEENKEESEKAEKKTNTRVSVSKTAEKPAVRASASDTNTTVVASTSRASLSTSKITESKPPVSKPAPKPASSAKPPSGNNTQAKKPVNSSKTAPIATKKDAKQTTKTLSLSIEQGTNNTSSTTSATTPVVSQTTETQLVQETVQESVEVQENVHEVHENVEVKLETENVEQQLVQEHVEQEIEHIQHVEVEVVEQVIEQEVVEPEPVKQSTQEAEVELVEQVEHVQEEVQNGHEEEHEEHEVEQSEQAEHEEVEQHEVVEQEQEQEQEELNNLEAENHQYTNESPNLSPVKKDFISLNGCSQNIVEETGIPVSEEQIVLNEEINQNELEIVSGNLNGASEANNYRNDDVMTRSFIEDASDPKSNPFNSEQVLTNGKNLDESCDLNRTHELFEGEESNTQESVNEPEQDKLVNGLNGLKLVDANSETPKPPPEWDLLELPAPVNPNDVDKKTTPNGKQKQPGSPGNQNSEQLKSVSKSQVQNHKQVKSGPINPVYVELSYIPAHGNGFYCDAEFFKRVRARHYVLSALEPSEAVLNALVEGKETWEDKNLQVSVIPSYESESMRIWYAQNEERLARLKIDILPAANYATITMDENPDLSCHVYKLEF